jgi:hypothetical protein
MSAYEGMTVKTPLLQELFSMNIILEIPHFKLKGTSKKNVPLSEHFISATAYAAIPHFGTLLWKAIQFQGFTAGF